MKHQAENRFNGWYRTHGGLRVYVLPLAGICGRAQVDGVVIDYNCAGLVEGVQRKQGEYHRLDLFERIGEAG